MADGLDVRPAEDRLVELQHVTRRAVDQLQPSLRVDDDDPFDHAGEDRFHPRRDRAPAPPAAARPPAPSRRARARRVAEFVVAEAEPRRRQIAAAVAARDAGDEAHPLADAGGEEPRDQRAADQRDAQRRQCRGQHRPQLLPDRRSAAAPRGRTRSRDASPAPRRTTCRSSACRCSGVRGRRRARVPRPPRAAARGSPWRPGRRTAPTSRQRRGRRPR